MSIVVVGQGNLRRNKTCSLTEFNLLPYVYASLSHNFMSMPWNNICMTFKNKIKKEAGTFM